jgi:hypothetical protein
MSKLIIYFLPLNLKSQFSWVIQNDYEYLSIATMYENLCGNCVNGIELTFV